MTNKYKEPEIKLPSSAGSWKKQESSRKTSISALLTMQMEKAMAPHSSTLAWKIPWTEEPGRLQSMGLLRVGHDWATSFSLSCTGEGNGNPLQCSCLENPRDSGVWWAAVYGVTQSRTWLKWLSSSSSRLCKSLWLCGSQQTVENSSRGEYQTTWPASWEICMEVKKQ